MARLINLALLVQRDRLAVVNWLRENVGTVAALNIWSMRLVVVTDLAIAKRILRDADDFGHKGLGLAEAKYFLGNGLLTASTGPCWSRARSTMASSFSRCHIDRLVIETSERAQVAIQQLKTDLRTQPRTNVMPYLGRATIEVIGTLMFGSRFVAVAPAILSDIRELSRWADGRLGFPLNSVTHASWLCSRSERRAYNRLIGIIDKLVVETSERASILASLFAAAGQNGQAVRDQAATLLLAGSETTTAATAWSLALLGQHPELQEKVALEGRSLPPPHDTRSTDLDRLGLTKAVVKEAMRLYPPVWAITRRTERQTDIGGYRFCAGSHVLINLYGIHRDNTLWETPDVFDPSRFEGVVHDPEYYMPFGMGARRCIGLHFGLAETCILVARFLASLKVDRAQHLPRAIADLTLRPDRPIELSLRST